jgi:hypothetical protein
MKSDARRPDSIQRHCLLQETCTMKNNQSKDLQHNSEYKAMNPMNK